MFCPPPDEETQTTSKVTHKNHNKKRKKKGGRKNFHGVGKNKKRHGKLALSMSAWAENFTFAATWQLKHQLAHWKARAKALEYENEILHEIIRKKNYLDPETATLQVDTVNTELNSETVTDTKCEPSTEEADSANDEQFEEEDEENENYGEEDDGEEGFEVSEEYIQFLQANAKYREDARLEREKLRAKNAESDVVEEMEAGPSETKENYEDVLKELYGDRWRRISALEMSLQSQFIHESDKDRPMYWPNIPFNLNFK